MAEGSPVHQAVVDLLDAVLYLDKKLAVQAHGVRLHPAEMHLLVCLAEGMAFAEVGKRFGISRAAVSQTVSRLVGKGLLEVRRDRGRTAAATVTLTPLGQDLLDQVRALRGRLADGLAAHLTGYSAGERSTITRFLHDLRDFVHGALASMSTTPTQAE